MEILEHLKRLESEAAPGPWVYREQLGRKYIMENIERPYPAHICSNSGFIDSAPDNPEARLISEMRITLDAFMWLAETVDTLEKAYPGLMRDKQFEAVHDALARLRRMKRKQNGNTRASEKSAKGSNAGTVDDVGS